MIKYKTDSIIICDLEASCWRSDKERPHSESSEVIEFGICLLDLNTYEINNAKSILIKPQMSTISSFCTELTSHTQNELDNKGISFKEACEMIRKEYSSRNRLWCSWGNYDRRMIEQEARLLDVAYPFINQHLNIKALFSVLYGEVCGMDRALEILNMPLLGRHHLGVDDAKNIAAIFGHILKKWKVSL